MTDVTINRQPILVQIKNGWAAHGLGWAVHAPTKEEVIQKYREREALYEEVDARPYWNEKPATASQNSPY